MVKEKKLVLKNKVTKKEITKTLDSIYRDEDGKKIDMKVRRMRKGSSVRRILVGLIVFFALIALVSWMGVLVFSRFSAGGADNLRLEITGDKKIVAGEEVEYKIKYQNKEDMPLASAEIGLYFPKSFILSEADPVLDEKNKLNLGTLKVGEGGIINFKGKFFATEGSKEVIQVVLKYKPSNFNSNFEKVENLEVEINGSIFDGSLEGPDAIIVGDSVIYKMTYKNKADSDLDRVAIDAVVPKDFIITTSTPQIDNRGRWEMGKLEAKAEGEVEITGSFSTEAKGDKEIVFKLGIIDEEGGFLSLIEKKVNTDVIGSDLVTNMLINGNDNFSTARWGEILNYTIIYKNEGKNTMYDVELIMNIEGLPKENGQSIVDWSSLQDLKRGTKDGEKIIWTKKQIDNLAKLEPGEEGIIDFSINVIQKPANPSYRDYKIDSILEAGVKRSGNVVVDRKLKGNKLTTFINSDTSFVSWTRYYDENNNMVGSGPIPPKVGEKTTYKVYWKIENSMHELENVKISGKLGEGVVFSGATAEAGSLGLDSSLKSIVWDLNRMPTSVNSLSAQFDLTFTPSANNVGNVAKLLEQIEFNAKDTSTGGTVDIKAGDETTALPDDPFVSKGEVEG